MLFNSLSFALFFPTVFLLYWFVASKKLKGQNALLLVSSYFFYGCWDYRFLFLLLFSTFLDYYSGIKIEEAASPKAKKIWLTLSIGINLGFLGIFKYYNFFADSFAEMLSAAGFEVHPATLEIVLPVGISFYTFHGLSYIIDIYKNRIRAERDPIDYAVFVSFFPLLVAGPIERATHLLPQIKKKRTFSYEQAASGMRQILWGLFKKIVIADNCATFVNTVFADSADYSSGSHVIAAVFFTLQIYGDFSGYSDIALGTARLLGIDLLRNFAFPFFSRDSAEFWRRWHISLSSWFRDYLYIPLGGSKGNTVMKIRNTFIIFIVSGFWHGANWTFIVWGLLNAFYIMPSIIFNTHRNHLGTVASGRIFPRMGEFLNMTLTFCLTVFAFIFFRADTMTEALHFISGIVAPANFTIPAEISPELLLLILFFFIVEWAGRENSYAIEKLGFRKPLRIAFYYGLALAIFLFAGSGRQFIYFQF